MPLKTGDGVQVTFEGVRSSWRQGVWLATLGELSVGGTSASQLVLWFDASPREVLVTCLQTQTGILTFYNVWDSGRGHGMESQRDTTGMLLEALADGGIRCRTQDISTDLDFDRLVFTLTAVSTRLAGNDD